MSATSEAAGRSVTVLGGAGFVGGAVVSALGTVDGGVDVHTMVRSIRSPSGSETVHLGDVTDVASVRSAVRGSRTVVHAAGYVGSDPELCHATNVVGTRNVVAACAAEGVERIVYVSAAALCGTGPHRGENESLPRAPESVLSRSRAAAEDLVFTAGGTAVRPHLIVGAGDRWFVPALVGFVDAVGGLVDGGAAETSAVHVSDVGTMVARLSVVDAPIPTGPLNAAYARPVSIADLASALAPATSWTLPLAAIPRETAVDRARALGYSDRQFALLTVDHWYDPAALGAVIRTDDLAGPTLTERDIHWYRCQLGR